MKKPLTADERVALGQNLEALRQAAEQWEECFPECFPDSAQILRVKYAIVQLIQTIQAIVDSDGWISDDSVHEDMHGNVRDLAAWEPAAGKPS
jgi:hypothetical protein